MELINGLQYNLKGLALGLRTPRLLMLGLLRFVLVLILVILASGLIIYRQEEILSILWTLPENKWLVYVWHAVSWILSLVLAGIAAILSYILAQVLFGVFIMDYMSKITEKIISGNVTENPASFLHTLWYLIKQEIPRALIPVLVSMAVITAGFFTPLGPLILLVSSLSAVMFLAWDNTDLVPARRMIPFNQRFSFLKQNIGFHVGFGLWFLVPWLNILFLSFAPVGATMYYLDRSHEQGDQKLQET